jgi:uncharacterized membrane protein
MPKQKLHFSVNQLIWLVYLALLAVLLPHTAWAFSRFESPNAFGTLVAWMGAFAFEASIATLTHKLAKHIENTPKRLASLPKFAYRYLNAYSLGLVISLGVSVLANLAHAVEFGGELAIFTSYSVPFGLYAVAFGAVLPLVSLLFARVLSNVADAEAETDPALEQAHIEIKRLRLELKQTEQAKTLAEGRAQDAETRFAAAGDLFTRLFGEEKRLRIMAARQAWPELPASAIAIIAGSSPSYVSEVLNA